MNRTIKTERRALAFTAVFLISYGALRQLLFLPWLESANVPARRYDFYITVVFTGLYSMPFDMILEGAQLHQWRSIMKNKPLSLIFILCYCFAFSVLMRKVFEYCYFDSGIKACCVILAACVIFVSNLWALIQFYFGQK